MLASGRMRGKIQASGNDVSRGIWPEPLLQLMTSVKKQGFFICPGKGKIMLFSIGIIILLGLSIGWAAGKIRLPYIVGMLIAGMLIGPYGLNILDSTILAISGDVRKIALIIILAKAGLSLSIDDLKKSGRPSVMLCFIPASFEILAFLLFAPSLLHVTLLQAAILGAVMGAVSPAVLVPRLSMMMDEKWGTKKRIPQMLIAGSSADDVFVIVIFTALVQLEAGGSFHLTSLLQIPESILFGAAAGAALGVLLSLYFRKIHIRDSLKVTILMAISMILYWMEDVLPSYLSISGLLAVMTMCILINHLHPAAARRLTVKFSKLWVAAEIFLFVLVGASVNFTYALSAGLPMVIMLLIGLVFRLAGTWISVIGTGLNRKERLFCMIAETPKATVQAAIGGIPLAMGLSCGPAVLSFAVIAILITAPLGALAIDSSYRKLLSHDNGN